MNLFDHDSGFFKFFSKVADIMLVSILWFGTSLLIITIGASTTAAYYVITRRISERESSIVMDYFTSFKSNFIQSTVVFVIIISCFVINFLNIRYNPIEGTFGLIIYGLQIIFAVQLVFIYIYVFPLIARFELSLVKVLQTACLFGNKHLFTTLTHIVVLIALLWLCFNAPFLFFFAIGFYCWVSSTLLLRVIRKYKPEFDKSRWD